MPETHAIPLPFNLAQSKLRTVQPVLSQVIQRHGMLQLKRKLEP